MLSLQLSRCYLIYYWNTTTFIPFLSSVHTWTISLISDSLNMKTLIVCWSWNGGKGGIRTHAPFDWSNYLANSPLQPLGYFPSLQQWPCCEVRWSHPSRNSLSLTVRCDTFNAAVGDQTQSSVWKTKILTIKLLPLMELLLSDALRSKTYKVFILLLNYRSR